jgi:hypothetical protein
MATRKSARKSAKKSEFEFTFEGKKYIIRPRQGQAAYQCQHATIVLSDGKILDVRVWKILQMEPQAEAIEIFDPEQRPAAEIAEERRAYLAELA